MTGATTPRRRGRPVRVTREEVVAATTRMLKQDGSAGFSMRRLADELGVSTAAVYHHFPGKAQLFIAVLSEEAERVPRPDLPDSPRDRLITLVMHVIEVLHELPWVVDVLVAGESFGRAAMWILDEFVGAAMELGADIRHGTYMYSAMWRFVLGELMMRRVADERAAAAAAGDPRPLWSDLVAPDEFAEFDRVGELLPELSRMREEFRARTAVAEFVDGMVLGIPRG
ncbi:TetR/AcrR family transcriptional regulator [Nocardia puris]|uniref:TetR/AcrR family transcriptional regulator n=1 Tax=Nocardia puris TaxID=208602 RepID=UPI00082ACB76|nr:TetR/AcrR family transcriptional regulator [Nocardia puris]